MSPWIAGVTAIGWMWIAVLVALRLAGGDVRRHHFEAPGLILVAGLFALAGWTALRRPQAVPQRPRPSSIVMVVPAALALGAYAWALGLGPLSDDVVLRAWAAAGDWLPERWPYVRPLPLVIWWAIITAGGGWIGLHALNLLLHALNAGLVGRLAAHWLPPPAATVAGIAFALFPAAAEAVAWTAGVFDLAATTCILGSVVLATAAPSTRARHLMILVLCGAGFLSKETAFVLPLLVAGALLALHGPPRERLGPALTTGIAAIAVVLARVVASPHVGAHLSALPDDRRAVKDLMIRPFAALALPFRTDTGIGPDVVVAAVLLLGLTALLVRALRQSAAPVGGAALLGLGWIAIASLPLLGDFYVSPALEGARFLYLPSVGLALLVATPLAEPRLGVAQGVAAACLVGLLGIYAVRVDGERRLWLEAARTRDAVIAEATRVSHEASCGTLTIANAPDTVRGVYVFREGLALTLAALPTTPGGPPCQARWTGSGLLLDLPGERGVR